MKFQISILDVLLLISGFGVVVAWHSIPSKPKALWNTEFFPCQQPNKIPPEFVDESKGAYVEAHGVSKQARTRTVVDLLRYKLC